MFFGLIECFIRVFEYVFLETLSQSYRIVRRPYVTRQNFCKGFNRFIASLMAKRVIYGLEIVDI